MPLEIKLWNVESDRCNPIAREQLDLEDHVETWLCEDISMLRDDLLVIGRQVQLAGPRFNLLVQRS